MRLFFLVMMMVRGRGGSETDILHGAADVGDAGGGFAVTLAGVEGLVEGTD